MAVAIVIRAGAVHLAAHLDRTPTADALAGLLPLTGQVQTWGEEIYFPVPLTMPLDATARDLVAAGDVGYWPQGPALCLFFGPTPASRGDEIRAASAVNIVGRIDGDPGLLRQVSDGEPIRIERTGER